METLFFVIIFVFAILQIVLFFKVWGMTNNVDAIKEVISPQSELWDSKQFRYLVLAGKKDDAANMLNAYVGEQLNNTYARASHVSDSDAYYTKNRDMIIGQHQYIYDTLGINIPEYMRFSYDQLKKLSNVTTR